MVARTSGLSIPTIRAGIAEWEAPDTVVPDRIWRPTEVRDTDRSMIGLDARRLPSQDGEILQDRIK